MVNALMYISQSRLASPEDIKNIEEIRDVSIARNSSEDLTGFLISTPSYFLQFLEGSRSGLELVMTSIRADERHYAIHEIEVPSASVRRYPRWRMNCFHPSSYVSRYIEPTLAGHHANMTPGEAIRIIDFIERTTYAAGSA